MNPARATDGLATVHRANLTSGLKATRPGFLATSHIAPLVPPVQISMPPPPPPDGLPTQQIVRQLARIPLHEADDRRRRETEFFLFTAIPGGLVSTIVHLLTFIGLGAYMLSETDWGADRISIVLVDGQDDAPEESALEELIVELPAEPLENANKASDDHKFWDNVLLDDANRLVEDLPTALLGLTDNRGDPASSGGGADRGSRFQVGRDATGGLACRAERRRRALSYGATPESENAVELALDWLVRHQRSNGSWSFMHRKGARRCSGCLCHNEGRAAADHAATAFALLALLGAGDTHLCGQYRDEIASGLRFLMKSQQYDGSLVDLQGRMYSHGLATLALCEALAMTREEYAKLRAIQDVSQADPGGSGITKDELSRAAQNAVQFVESAQHVNGGWRYQPGQPGDTSIVGWQLMALKSAHLAGLNVDPQVVQKAIGFLDSVSDDRIGSCYGYTSGRKALNIGKSDSIGATTPIGLLCRMYTGWDHQQPGLKHGVERLSLGARPGKGLYYYYYATQVMHHYDGPAWEEWDLWMRNYLVRSQVRSGSERGSWQYQGSFDDAGRLYCTALAVMTLEVYYRYSPIYGEEVLTASP